MLNNLQATAEGIGKGLLVSWMPFDRVRARAESSPVGRFVSVYGRCLRATRRDGPMLELAGGVLTVSTPGTLVNRVERGFL